jgi:IclR family transcriptional regulator, pca regulon regulatory protein
MGSKRKSETPRDYVGSVKHAFDVLKAFDKEHFQMTLSEVSERTGMTRAGARRYLVTLEHLGYIRKEDRLFRLTPRVLELGFSLLSTVALSDIVQPYLQRITRETGEITGFAVLDAGDIVHISSSTVERMLAPTLTIGRRFNALYMSSGRAIAAFLEPRQVDALFDLCKIAPLTAHSLKNAGEIREELDRVRRQHYAIADQETEVGVRTIAVPVLNRQRVPQGAVTLLTNVATVSKKQLVEEMLPVLQRVVSDIPV